MGRSIALFLFLVVIRPLAAQMGCGAQLKPLKPLTIGCVDTVAACSCPSVGSCHWVWVCAEESPSQGSNSSIAPFVSLLPRPPEPTRLLTYAEQQAAEARRRQTAAETELIRQQTRALELQNQAAIKALSKPVTIQPDEKAKDAGQPGATEAEQLAARKREQNAQMVRARAKYGDYDQVIQGAIAAHPNTRSVGMEAAFAYCDDLGELLYALAKDNAVEYLRIAALPEKQAFRETLRLDERVVGAAAWK